MSSSEPTSKVPVKVKVAADETRRVSLSAHLPPSAVHAKVAELIGVPVEAFALELHLPGSERRVPVSHGWAGAAAAAARPGAPLMMSVVPRAGADGARRSTMVVPRAKGPWPKAEKPAFEVIEERKAGDGDEDDDSDGSWTVVERPGVARANATATAAVTFTVNGETQSVQAPSPTLTLAEYLRRTLGLTATKVGCGEAGCGACSVLLTPPSGGAALVANSCIRPVASLDGWQVLTNEGVGSPQTGLSKVQQAMVDNDASQCGYCSSGMVMAMEAVVRAAGSGQPTAEQLEAAFDGNICRCTGYRPILAAARSLAAPDIEDVVGGSASAAASDPGRCAGGGNCAKCPKRRAETASWVDSGGSVWVEPATLDDVLLAFSEHAGEEVRLVRGNTGHSVAKYYLDDPAALPSVYVNVAAVPELVGVTLPTADGDSKFVVGAATTLSELRSACMAASSVPGYSHAEQLAAHIGRVANHQVRNMASWAGNLAVAGASPQFPSDMRTVLAAAGAQVSVVDAATGARSSLGVPVLCAPNGLPRGRVILSLTLPPLAAGTAFYSYKVADRAQNAHALVNAAFALELTSAGAVSNAYLAFGGVKTGLVEAPSTVAYLGGKKLTPATLAGALDKLSVEVTPPLPEPPHPNHTLPSVAYRRSVACAFFYLFWMRAAGTPLPAPTRALSSGTNTFTPDQKEAPVSLPVPKLAAPEQVAGTAAYTDDEPGPARVLEAAYVLSDRAPATLVSLDVSAALAMPGVVRVVTAHDIAAMDGASNNCGAFPGDEEILVSSFVTYPGQPLALVCADTREHAERAALAVVPAYGPPPKGVAAAPVVTAAQAIAAGSYLADNKYVSHIKQFKKGDAPSALAAAKASGLVVQGELSNGAQSHFFMETQACLAVPDADGTLRVVASTQSPSSVQGALALALGVSPSLIEVTTRRTGGAYGGKLTRDAPVAAAVSLAARALGRPVRMQLSRGDDLRNMGKRHPFLFKYEAGFTDAGVLTAYTGTVFCVGGYSYDVTMGVSDAFMQWADNCYSVDNWLVSATPLRTNAAPNTAMRAPGAMQATFYMECVLERAAWELGLAPAAVRQANMYSKATQTTQYGQAVGAGVVALGEVWKNLEAQADVAARRKEVATFNATHRFLKRGIRVTPVKYGIQLAGYFMGVRLNAYPADGSVSVSTTGVEIGQGLHTKVAQAVALGLGIDMSLVSVTSCSTRDFPAFTLTGGSGTSESCVAAALDAADAMNKALAATRKANPSASWPELVAAAYGAGVNLSQQGWYHGAYNPEAPFDYFVYGAACSEVEVDALTGAVQVVRSDIMFDSGVSLNYAVDVGQVQGAFVQGLGFLFTEEVVQDAETGVVRNAGTWDYKPPSSMDVPVEFNVTCLGEPNKSGVLGSKASGEPPLMLAASAFFAAKDAIRAARESVGLGGAYFDLVVPATPAVVQSACGVDVNHMTM